MFLKQFNQLGTIFKQGKNILILFIGVGISSQVFAQKAAEIMHEKILDNGLKVIVKEDHRSPTVAHMIWYKTGAIDENYGVTGVAHVLEHMMFKGTKNIASGEFSKKIAVALEKTVPCKRIGIAVIGLEVPHAHVHLIPLNEMGEMTFKHKVSLTKEEFETLAKSIKANL